MADIHRTQLELIYNTSAGRQVTFAILDPRDNITTAEAESVAQTILSKNVFTYNGGELSKFEGAQIRVLNVTKLA